MSAKPLLSLINILIGLQTPNLLLRDETLFKVRKLSLSHVYILCVGVILSVEVEAPPALVEREEKIFTMGPLPLPLPGGHVGRWSHVISLSHGDT